MSSQFEKLVIVARAKSGQVSHSSQKDSLAPKSTFLTFTGSANSLDYTLFDSVEKAMLFDDKDDAIIKIYNAKNQWEEHKVGWEKKISETSAAEERHTMGGSRRLSGANLSFKFSYAESLRRENIDSNVCNLDKFDLSVEPLSEHCREAHLALTFDHYLYLKKTNTLDKLALYRQAFLPKQGISINPGFKEFDTRENALAHVNAWVKDFLYDLTEFYEIINPDGEPDDEEGEGEGDTDEEE